MDYSIKIKKSAEKEIISLPKSVIPRIIKAIEKLKDNPYPRNAKKLTGSEMSYRLRIGEYRIIYQVDRKKHEIVIYRVRKRENVYNS